MASTANMVTDVRSRIVEPTASFFSDAELVRWLNQGYRRFLAQTEWTERCTAIRTIANQFQYNLGTDIIKVQDVRWTDQYKIWFRDLEEFGRYMGQSGINTGPRPYMYRLMPGGNNIMRIYPKPSGDSVSTTITDCSVSSSATTINVVSTASFPSYGRLLNSNTSEQILYYAKTSTSFTQCVRGDGATTAATLAFGNTLYHAPLEVYNVYQPADLVSGTSDPTIPDMYCEAIINYACYAAMLKRERYDEAQMFLGLYDKITKTAIEERRRVQLDRLHVIKDEDEYGQYYSWV